MAKPGTLTIDPEFKALLHPLTPDEYNTLQGDIIANGCLDSIKVWNDAIIDGHNRYEICHANGILFRTLPMYFNSRLEALIWMRTNQRGRRNQNDMQRVENELELGKLLEAKARENQRDAGGDKTKKPLLSDLTKADPIHVRKEIAKSAGVSEGTVAAVQKNRTSASPDLANAVRKGEARRIGIQETT